MGKTKLLQTSTSPLSVEASIQSSAPDIVLTTTASEQQLIGTGPISNIPPEDDLCREPRAFFADQFEVKFAIVLFDRIPT